MEGGGKVQRTAITGGYVNARAKRATSPTAYVWRSTSTRRGDHGHSRGGGLYSKNNFNIKAENSLICSYFFYKLFLKKKKKNFFQLSYTCTTLHNTKKPLFSFEYVTLYTLCKKQWIPNYYKEYSNYTNITLPLIIFLELIKKIHEKDYFITYMWTLSFIHANCILNYSFLKCTKQSL